MTYHLVFFIHGLAIWLYPSPSTCTDYLMETLNTNNMIPLNTIHVCFDVRDNHWSVIVHPPSLYICKKLQICSIKMTNIKSSLNLFENLGHKRYVCYPTLRMKLNVISNFSLVVLWNVYKPIRNLQNPLCTQGLHTVDTPLWFIWQCTHKHIPMSSLHFPHARNHAM